MLTTIFAMLVTAASPVTDPANGAATAIAAVTNATGAITAPANRKPTQYCVVDTFTGSRIPVKLCKTRDEWMARGFDPLMVK